MWHDSKISVKYLQSQIREVPKFIFTRVYLVGTTSEVIVITETVPADVVLSYNFSRDPKVRLNNIIINNREEKSRQCIETRFLIPKTTKGNLLHKVIVNLIHVLLIKIVISYSLVQKSTNAENNKFPQTYTHLK